MKRIVALALALSITACGRQPDRLVDGSGRVVYGRLTGMDAARAEFDGFSVPLPWEDASVLLRSGALYRGRVSLESGVLTVSESGRETALEMRDVAAVTWGPSSTQSLLLDVHACAGWTDTHVEVEQGSRIVVLAAGRSIVGTGATDPEGLERTATTLSLAPASPDGCLVGRIGSDGEPFSIGDSWSGIAGRAGNLELAVNAPSQGVPSGCYTVSITVESDGGDAPFAIFPAK